MVLMVYESRFSGEQPSHLHDRLLEQLRLAGIEDIGPTHAFCHSGGGVDRTARQDTKENEVEEKGNCINGKHKVRVTKSLIKH